jgi:hypothetical protein
MRLIIPNIVLNVARMYNLFVCLFVLLGLTSHQHSIGHMATLQLYWWRKTSDALPCIISGTNGHLSRTTDVPWASWISSSHKRVQSPCRDSNQQMWGASGLKSTTLTTRSRTPLAVQLSHILNKLERVSFLVMSSYNSFLMIGYI